MAKKKKQTVKNPSGEEMDYKVQPIKVMTVAEKEKAKADAKAKAKPAISGQAKKKKGKK